MDSDTPDKQNCSSRPLFYFPSSNSMKLNWEREREREERELELKRKERNGAGDGPSFKGKSLRIPNPAVTAAVVGGLKLCNLMEGKKKSGWDEGLPLLSNYAPQTITSDDILLLSTCHATLPKLSILIHFFLFLLNLRTWKGAGAGEGERERKFLL